MNRLRVDHFPSDRLDHFLSAARTATQLVGRQAGAKLLVGPVESSAAHLRRPGLTVLRE